MLPSDAAMIGRTISHYKVLSELGRGGMGVVYKAEDTKLRRTVALKFPPVDKLASEEEKARFVREAQAAAALNHPNICTVYEIDEADGHTFIAMEFVEGLSVKEKSRARPLPLDITVQAAQGLQAAHEKDVVHRDVKSANLMVTAQGRVKVMDFGLAQVGDRSQLTKTGTTLGTASYMSPEQALAQPTDRRTDIWSLGVVLYEMLTGRLPFEAEVEAAVAYAVVNTEPEFPTALRSGLPVEIDHVIDKALAKDRDERYQHVDEMLVDLRAVMKGQPEAVRAKAPLRVHRRHALLASAGLAVAALAVVLGMNFNSLREQLSRGSGRAPIASIVVLPIENFTGDPEQEYFADGMTIGLFTALAKIRTLRVISPRSAMRYKGTNKSLREIAEELHVDAVIQGAAQRFGERARIMAELIDPETDQLLWAESFERDFPEVLLLQSDVARAVTREIKGELSPQEEILFSGARRVNAETHEAYLKGMFLLQKGSPEDMEIGMALLQEAVDKDPTDSLAHAGLALGYTTLLHGPAFPADAVQRAKAATLNALELDDTLAMPHASLGFLQGYWDWDWEASERSFQRSLELNPSLAIAHYYYSWVHYLFGRMDEALASHKRAQELSPLHGLHTAWLGYLYYSQGRYEEATAEARKSLEVDTSFYAAYFVLSEVYAAKGLHEEAIAIARQAVAINPRNRFILGRAYALAGRRSDARKIVTELEEDEKNAPWRAWSLALVHTALGEKDDAFRHLNYERPQAFVPWVRVMVEWEPLRDDPRFQDLLRRMNLPPI